MPIHKREEDADFYKLIHQVTSAGAAPVCAPLNRRNRLRRPFHCLQQIAPRRGADIPARSEFFEVHCHDLTGQGFSFLLPEMPDFDALVVAFKIPPRTTYVAAEVVRCTRVLVYPPEPGQPLGSWLLRRGVKPGAGAGVPRILVGCRFTERLQRKS